MRASLATARIRTFSEADIPQVAELHRTVFRTAASPSAELLDSYRTYFREVFLNNPWSGAESASLVHEEHDGRITGFMGAFHRRMYFRGCPIVASISSQFIVDRDHRGMAGLKLLRAHLEGPQDLSIADEANTDARVVWEWMGGATSFVHSMRWCYPLRPFRFGVQCVTTFRRLSPLAARISIPPARVLDWVLERVPANPLRPARPALLGKDLGSEELAELLSEYSQSSLIRPDYDRHSVNWLLRRADGLRRSGKVRRVALFGEAREPAGWYLYHCNPGGLSEVLHIGAQPGFQQQVIGHLFWDAWCSGATALSGRVEPALMDVLSEQHCPIHAGPQWVLVYSRNEALLDAFRRGEVFFTRLDGEWCHHFR